MPDATLLGTEKDDTVPYQPLSAAMKMAQFNIVEWDSVDSGLRRSASTCLIMRRRPERFI